MKIIGLFVAVAQSQSSCYWAGTTSGKYLECLPDFYLKGACESGSRNDCNIDAGIIGTDASFGIKCCPTDRNLDLSSRGECLWVGGDSGINVACNNGMAAFGRCSRLGYK